MIGFLTWYPCQNPERIPDARTTWHVGCHGCAVAYEAEQAPPPPGEFDGWHREWSADILAAMRDSDMDALRALLGGSSRG